MRKNLTSINSSGTRKLSANQASRNNDEMISDAIVSNEQSEATDFTRLASDQLNLPEIVCEQLLEQPKRAMSAGGLRDEGLLLSVCESNNSGKDETQTASSSQTSIKDRKEFRVKVIKMYQYDRSAKE